VNDCPTKNPNEKSPQSGLRPEPLFSRSKTTSKGAKHPMAKDGTLRGGRRVGSGHPRSPLTEKLLTGNHGHPITHLKVLPADEEQKPSGFIMLDGKEGGSNVPSAASIFTLMQDFLSRVGCSDIVPLPLVEDFAFLRRSYLECEYMNRDHGRIANGKRSPYVTMALDYQRASLQVFNHIWSIIEKNSAEQYEKKNDFLNMLKSRGF
jgi:hypothetical protein